MNYQEEYAQKVDKVREQRHKILIVDDSEMNRAVLSEILKDEFEIIEACDGAEALALLQKHAAELSLVLLDIVMPRMDGFDVLVVMNRFQWIEHLPVIMISSETSGTTVQKAYELGASDYIGRPFNAAVVHRRVMNTIMLYDRQRNLAALAVDQIYEREKTSRLMVHILSHVVEHHNGESGPHVLHVELMTELLAKAVAQYTDRYPLSPKEIAVLSDASAIHDIGKIAIPTEIINKPGKLTEEEFAVMKTHSMLGADMIADIPAYQDEPLVKVSYEVCRWHHERWDGSGYPDGLKGDDIPISAQIVSLADVYDALTSERIYKKALSHEQAVQMILDGKCGSFNPVLLECFREIQGDIPQELEASALRRQEDLDIQEMADELLHNEDLSASEHTLKLLEYERMKLQFYNSVSSDIQFEQVLSPSMLILSERDAKRLGMHTVTMDPLKDERYLSVFGKETVEELVRRFHQATPEEPEMQTEFTIRLDGEERRHRIVCRAMWDPEQPDQCISVIGKIIDIHRERNT